ncbi:MAG: glycosyltransferase [Nitrospirae bacterium]|nr:glycosyltransferase [Nitrospirota bacterium]
MRVMFLVHGLPVGGTERVVVDLCHWLRGHGVDLFVACLDELGAFGMALAAEGVDCHQLNRRPGLDLGLPGRIARLARREEASLIHAHQYTPFFYAALARRRAGIPLLFTEHGRFYPDPPSWKRRLFNRTVGRRVDHVTAVSGQVRDALVDVEGMAGNAIEVLYNGVDLSRFGAPPGARARLAVEWGVPPDATVVGTVARLNTIKNQALLLAAFARVAAALPDAHLLVVGDGPEFGRLTQQAEKLGIADRAHFVGERADVPFWLACMDVFALSSLSEGMPMTLLEAMAARVPIVSTAVGGIGEMLEDGAEALLVASGDTDALANALLALCADPARRGALTAAAHDRVARAFSLDVIGGRYLEIYRGLCRSGSKKR